MDNINKKKAGQPSKIIKYKTERKDVAKKVLDIIGITQTNNTIILKEMNHNIQQKLLDLEDEIKKYYNVAKWPVFKNNTEIDKTYLSIIKSVMKEHTIKMTNFYRYEQGDRISCYIFENYNNIFE